MSGVVYYLEVILVGYLLYPFNVAEIAVYMNRNYSTGIVCDEPFDKVCIYGVVCVIDIAEYGSKSVSYDSVCS